MQFAHRQSKVLFPKSVANISKHGPAQMPISLSFLLLMILNNVLRQALIRLLTKLSVAGNLG